MMNLFKNGNKIVAKLTIARLAWGGVTVALIQVMGYLPNLDFLAPRTLKLVSFALATILSCSKSAEMFFDKTTQMFKNHEISLDDEPTTTKIKNETTIETTASPSTGV